MKSKHLATWEEVVDEIVDVDEDHIVFKKIGPLSINNTTFLKKVKGFIGKKITVIRTDCQNKEYLLREVNK